MAADILPAIKSLETRQDRKMDKIDAKLDMLVSRSQSWSKQNIWTLVKWVVGGVGALALMLLSHWISSKFGG